MRTYPYLHRGLPHVRVLYVDYTAHFGGAILSLADLLPHMREVGVEPFLLTFQPAGALDGRFAGIPVESYRIHLNYVTRAATRRTTEKLGLPHPVRSLVSTTYNAMDFAYGFRLSRLVSRSIHRNRIDLVHMNNGLDVNSLRAAARAGLPSVGHMRGMVTKNTAHILRTAERYAARSLRGVIAVSEEVRRTGIEHGLDPDRIVTIHNPVDVGAFDRARSRRDEVRRRHGFEAHHVVGAAFGRVMPFKGQREFLQAAAALAGDLPDLRIMIVGDASDSLKTEYWEELQRMASGEPLRGRVVFTGYQDDPLPYYHASDIVVHSALGSEGFGRVVVEGMAAGKPVIATDAGGPRDIVTDGVDGVLVGPGNVERLREVIGRLTEDRGLRQRMGEVGRRTAEKRFSTRAIAERVGRMYRSAVRLSSERPKDE